MTDTDAPLLLLVGSGVEAYRGYLLRSAARRYRLWLLSPQEPAWESPYLAGHTLVDTLDAEATTRAAATVARSTPVRGVLCYDEFRIWPAAVAAQALGLPGSPPGAVEACRDKHLGRRTLAEAGVPQPRSLAVSTLDEARAAAGVVGYPLVLKPRAMGASLGVARVEGPDALAAAYTACRAVSLREVRSYSAGVLVEEYLDGPEISIDAACRDGVVTPLVLARKRTGFPPYFEEVGHVVRGDDPLLRDPDVLRVLRDAHAALKFTTGVTHTELRLTPAGPRVIEVNGRIGGDLIPYAGGLATGLDIGLVAADLAAGAEPELTPTRARTAAIRFFYPEVDLQVGGVEIDDARRPAHVELLAALARPGQQLRLPPRSFAICRHAVAVAVADDERTCQAALDAAGAAVVLTGTPLPAP